MNMNAGRFRPVGLAAMAIAALGIGGCGGGADDVAVVPAGGKLTFKGQPLEGYDVFFAAVEDGRRAHGVTDSQGHFDLGTNAPGDGAPVGMHEVYITLPPPELEGEPGREMMPSGPQKRSVLPRKYEAPKTSGLTMEVPPEGSQELNIDL